jgi:hypothetical protein
MARKYDAVYAQRVQVERLAEKDATFARNYTALVHNRKYRQLIPCVSQWLVRQALARERRQEQRFQPSRQVNQVERELFGA